MKITPTADAYYKYLKSLDKSRLLSVASQYSKVHGLDTSKVKEQDMNLNKVKLAEIATTILKEYVDVDLSKVKYKVDGKKIYVSERGLAFATEYDVFSPKSNSTIKFKFTHSTGPEFDPETQWVYKGPNGLEFIVTNDPVITRQLKSNYLQGKLGK